MSTNTCRQIFVDTVTDYIRICEDTIVPSRKVSCFHNNKPINKETKSLLNRKKRAFMAKDCEELRAVQKELKRKLGEAKNNFREKIEAKMGQNNAKDMWNGMKRMTGCSMPPSGVQGDREFATELNLFFKRFNTTFTPVCSDSVARSPPIIPKPIHTTAGDSFPLTPLLPPSLSVSSKPLKTALALTFQPPLIPMRLDHGTSSLNPTPTPNNRSTSARNSQFSQISTATRPHANH